MKISRRIGCVLLLVALAAVVRAADHGDAPLFLDGTARVEANLTDLYAFTSGDNLVVALATNPAIPPGAESYVFPTDVTFDINIDVDSPVDPADPTGLDGGTILDPDHIREDLTFRIRFRDDGSLKLQQIDRRPRGPRAREKTAAPTGRESERVSVSIAGTDPEEARRGGITTDVALFAGLRDDPFIRTPRIGRNVGAIVLQLPISAIVGEQTTLLIWATSKVEEFEGPFQDHVGRALRSMFGENAEMNVLPPREHLRKMGVVPDVMIYDVARPAHFPNGRALEDDVVDIVGDPRVLANDVPPVDTNDAEFLTAFPYLAEPH